jgi:23S rRNA (adenine2503-C2)-methyltransferase
MSSSLIPSLYGLDKPALTALAAELGQPAYRADQLWNWLYVSRAETWDEMKNIPSAFRDQLAERYALAAGEVCEQSGLSGRTTKLLVELLDKNTIEEVILPAPGRRTVCISSQVGCKIGCVFCASGQAGFLRNLDAGEIIFQVILASRVYEAVPTNIVFMGIGEPLDNYEEVIKAIRILNDNSGLNIGARKITVSTSGIIPGIEALSAEGRQIELSVSLHAPDDETRGHIMPLNRRYPIKDLLQACREYTTITKRIITFEYTLIKGVNDSEDQARQLVSLLKQFPCRVNLIPLSPIDEYDGVACTPETADLFIGMLGRAGINATLRDSRGRGMNAACGQLRSRFQRQSAAGSHA